MTKQNKPTKKEYSKPQLIKHGKLEEHTKGGGASGSGGDFFSS